MRSAEIGARGVGGTYNMIHNTECPNCGDVLDADDVNYMKGCDCGEVVIGRTDG